MVYFTFIELTFESANAMKEPSPPSTFRAESNKYSMSPFIRGMKNKRISSGNIISWVAIILGLLVIILVLYKLIASL